MMLAIAIVIAVLAVWKNHASIAVTIALAIWLGYIR